MTDAFGVVAGLALATVDTIEFEEGFEMLPSKALGCNVSNLILPKSLKLMALTQKKGTACRSTPSLFVFT